MNPEEGRTEWLRTELRTYSQELSEGRSITIQNVPTDIWNIDGKEEEGYGPEAGKMIEEAIEKKYPGYYDKWKKKSEKWKKKS